MHEDVEYYSYVRGLMAMDKADVCLLVVDSSIGVTEQDQKLANMAVDRGCAIVILLNKWDLIDEPQKQTDLMQSLAQRMAFAPWAPTLNISALTGRAVGKVFDAALAAAQAHRAQIRTSELNDFLAALREGGHTVSEKGRRLKLMYATQTGTEPPVFTFFCNFPDLVDDNFERYLENRIRDAFGFEGTSLKFIIRERDEEKK